MHSSDTSVLKVPGMLGMLLAAALGFSGYALLLPISPSWAIAGGANEAAAGSVTAVLMGFTIVAQLNVTQALRRFGWTPLLAAALLCLGLPAPLQALSSDIVTVLITTAVRGIGFGIITVCGASAMALLVPPHQRGRAVGTYGLAVSIPQLVFASAAPWLASVIGTPWVLVLGALPLIGLAIVAPVGARLTALDRASEAAAESRLSPGELMRRIWPALLALLLVTSMAGALLTFANQIAPSSQLATFALLALTSFSTASRFAAGALSDRHGTRTMVPVLGVATAVGTAALCASLLVSNSTAAIVVLLAGAAVLGIAYGGQQSATLVRAFAQGGPGTNQRVSVKWNVAFDLGTGAGALLIGALAQTTSFATALGFGAVIALAGTVVATRERAGSSR